MTEKRYRKQQRAKVKRKAKQRIQMERIELDTPAEAVLLAGMFSMTVQLLFEERQHDLDIGVYERDFYSKVKERGVLEPHEMQELIVATYNRYSRRNVMVLQSDSEGFYQDVVIEPKSTHTPSLYVVR